MSFDFDGKLIDFDPNQAPILELVLSFFSLTSINEICSKLSNEEIYKGLYRLEKTKEFKKIYSHLINRVSNELGEVDFYYQKIPSFRVHRVDQKSVNFHNDCMYGHGEDVLNLWVPLVDTNQSNALLLLTNQKSKELFCRFRDDKLSIEEANKLFLKHSNTALTKYGQILVFKTSTIHGTIKNSSKNNRISFDFRILPRNSDAGFKSLNEFFEPYFFETVKVKSPCVFYLYKSNPLIKNLSHFVQREIINMYASENNFTSAAREETEIYGVNHSPTIFNYVKDNKINDILMPSILCLPVDIKMRIEALLLAEKNNVKLHFCLENKVSSNLLIDDLNKYYQLLLEADNFLE